MFATLSRISENIDGCDGHYRCATALYLISILSQAFYILIDRGISAPSHVREVLYDINVIDKKIIFRILPTLQLPGENSHDTQMVIHTVTRTYDVILAS